jgi:hypothetical protein
MTATAPAPAIRLAGRQLISGESGVVLATLGEDERWRTPDGCDSIDGTGCSRFRAKRLPLGLTVAADAPPPRRYRLDI